MALNYLHGKKIIFGDLNPSKVLLDNDGKFLINDKNNNLLSL